jgi:hypothetical protein
VPRVSVGFSYFRRVFGGFLVTDNVANKASDFTQFNVAAPADSRFTNPGAALTVYHISPALVAATQNVNTFASSYMPPAGVRVSGNFQSLPGPAVQAMSSTPAPRWRLRSIARSARTQRPEDRQYLRSQHGVLRSAESARHPLQQDPRRL